MYMNRMEKVFGEMKEKGQKISVLYFPVGDPKMGDAVEWAGKYFNNGCTVLEIGLPFENPVLDGPTVANSMARALEVCDLEDVFGMIRKMREAYPDNILQVMTYYGNVEKYGIKGFAKKCAEAGADAVLSPNTPKEKVAEMDRELEALGLHNLRFVSFNLSEEEIEDCRRNAYGYIFQQAVDGGTGARETVSPHIRECVEAHKAAGTKTPVVPGFGISNAKQAQEVIDMGADGFVVGSATIKHILEGDGEEFIRSLGKVCGTAD